MNILDAIKSGKRFRRKPSIPGTVSWIGPLDAHTHWGASFRLDDMLAEDWEVEEKQVTITESHFESAVARASQSFSIYNPPYICEYLTQLKKELGL